MAEDTGRSTPRAGSPPPPPPPAAAAATAPAMDGPSANAAAAAAGSTEDTAMTVNIKQLNGPDFELVIRRDELVSKMKTKVREQTDIDEVGAVFISCTAAVFDSIHVRLPGQRTRYDTVGTATPTEQVMFGHTAVVGVRTKNAPRPVRHAVFNSISDLTLTLGPLLRRKHYIQVATADTGLCTAALFRMYTRIIPHQNGQQI